MTQHKLDGLYTGAGRLISGSLTEKNTKDHKGNPVPPEKQTFFFMVAVPKTDPNVAEVIGQLYQMAAGHYAQMPRVMSEIQQGLAANNFSWKIIDGDTQKVDEKTGQYVDRGEHYKGCYVFKFSTMFPMSACNMQGSEINPADIKRGDYVDVFFSSQPNGATDHTAGIYLNPHAIMLVGYGEPIATGVSATSAFAGRQHQLPQGASATPTSAGAVPPPGAAGAPGGMPAPAGMPAPQQPAAPAGMPAPQQPAAPAADPTQPGGGMPAPSGMPTGTTSPTEAGVQPHTGILNGPNTGGGQ